MWLVIVDLRDDVHDLEGRHYTDPYMMSSADHVRNREAEELIGRTQKAGSLFHNQDSGGNVQNAQRASSYLFGSKATTILPGTNATRVDLAGVASVADPDFVTWSPSHGFGMIDFVIALGRQDIKAAAGRPVAATTNGRLLLPNIMRVPPHGSATGMDVGRVIGYTLCCQIESRVLTCPSQDQIGSVLVHDPATSEHFARILVHDRQFDGSSCRLYWTMIN